VKRRQKRPTRDQLARIKAGKLTLRGLADELGCSVSGARWAYYRALGRTRRETLGGPKPAKRKKE
jgi:hypothetical protein